MSLVLLIVAIVCFAFYGVVGFFAPLDARVSNLVLGVGLACWAASTLNLR